MRRKFSPVSFCVQKFVIALSLPLRFPPVCVLIRAAKRHKVSSNSIKGQTAPIRKSRNTARPIVMCTVLFLCESRAVPEFGREERGRGPGRAGLGRESKGLVWNIVCDHRTQLGKQLGFRQESAYRQPYQRPPLLEEFPDKGGEFSQDLILVLPLLPSSELLLPATTVLNYLRVFISRCVLHTFVQRPALIFSYQRL